MNARKKRERQLRMRALKAGAAVIAVCLAAVIGAAVYEESRRNFYESHFLPATDINGVDVSEMTVDEAKDLLTFTLPDVALTQEGEEIERFNLSEIGGSYSYEEPLQKILEGQDEGRWRKLAKREKTYAADPVLSYDEGKIQEIVLSLRCVNDPDAADPENAFIAKTDSGFAIVPETQGTRIDPDLLVQALEDALAQWIYTVEVTDCRVQAQVKSTDLTLTDAMQAINNYSYVIIDMSGGAQEVMDKATAMSMIDYDETSGTVQADTEAVEKYTALLAQEYNTLGTVRTFTTHDGAVIQVGGSEKDTFGYEMDEETTAARICSALMDGYGTWARWPVAGSTRTQENDFGTTYVEVSIRQQHLWYYVDGVLQQETDVVTGTGSNSTTPGVFMILNKQSPATLEGAGYSTDVTYWMPVTYTGTGLHDATWRTEFGKDVYVSGGSHGCVNMPLEEAEKLYNSIEMGTPVIIY